MESASGLLPVFQYRNWLVDNSTTQFDDDNDVLQETHLTHNLDTGTSSLQGWNAASGLAVQYRSARSDDDQWETPVGTFQQHARMALDISTDPELVPFSFEQVNHEIPSYPRDRHNSVEPWSPFAPYRIFPMDILAPATYNISLSMDSRLGTPSIYYTAASEIVTTEVYHSAASHMGRYRNAVLGTMSVSVNQYILQIKLFKLTSSDRKSEYLELLRSRGLWPVDPRIEQNWSGEGQHVEFKMDDIGRINKLLTVENSLGAGGVGFVHKVKCRGISMARKTIHTGEHFTKDQAIEEVVHMTRLKHSHIIRLIGTYIWMKEFCMLMYPVANGNLEMFLECLTKNPLEMVSPNANALDKTLSDEPHFDITQATAMASSCLGFFSCLSSAIRYIHGSITKHMDIKPQNILVRSKWHYRGGGRSEYNSKVYISDFGISRSYESIDAANTDSPIGFTRRYASPEVVQRLDRDLSADIFSLGCVFLQMFVALDSFQAEQSLNAHSRVSPGLHENKNPSQASKRLQEELQNLLSSNHNSDDSYQGNLGPLQKLLKARIPGYEGTSTLCSSTLQMILKMLQFVPQQRPKADDLVQEFGEKACCRAGPEELEAVDARSEENAEHYMESIMKEQILQQGDGPEITQESPKAPSLWNEHSVAGDDEDSHLSRRWDGEVEEEYLSLLTRDMGCWC
jgi:serine/threonine protein kinase